MNDVNGRSSRKIAVLGPIPRDQVVTHAGEQFHKYGCVMYTAVALSSLLDAGDTIVPISHVRRDDEGPIKQILGSFPNIDTSGACRHRTARCKASLRWERTHLSGPRELRRRQARGRPGERPVLPNRICVKPSAVSWRSQSRCISHPTWTTPVGLPPAWAMRRAAGTPAQLDHGIVGPRRLSTAANARTPRPARTCGLSSHSGRLEIIR